MTDGSAGGVAEQAAPRGASEAELREALRDANLPTLALALWQITGERRFLEGDYEPQKVPGADDFDSGGLSEEAQERLRDEAIEVISALRAGTLEPAPPPPPEELVEMLGRSMGIELPAGLGPLLAEEMGIATRRVEMPAKPAVEDFKVVVVGAGFSGMNCAIELRRAGIEFTIVEKNDTIGGTWLENSYPGCGVDTPSHLYSFSFAQNPGWTRYFAKRDEIYDYAERVAAEYDIHDDVMFNTEVVAAHWDEDAQLWHVRVRDEDGTEQVLDANAVFTGVGFFNRPAYPDIKGLGSFSAGPTVHTAQWPADLDLTGKRVAVIGTGASSMQLVPAICERTERVMVFQRTPQWGIPHPNYRRDVSEASRLLMAEVPNYLHWYRARLVWTYGDKLHKRVFRDPDWPHPERAISRSNDNHREYLTGYIREQLGDRADELMDRCVPSYPPYGKRPLLDNGWFEAMARDDVDLVTTDIEEIRPEGVATVDGKLWEADVLVLATGFEPQRLLAPMEIRGRSGKALREYWGDDDPSAYLGTTVPDFPNLFCIFGPNTFAGHGGSGILTIELQVRYSLDLIRQMLERGITSVEVRQDVHDAYNAEMNEQLDQTIWAHPGMTTYYRNPAGRIVVPMPWTNAEYWRRTRHADLGEYLTEGPAEA